MLLKQLERKYLFGKNVKPFSVKGAV